MVVFSPAARAGSSRGATIMKIGQVEVNRFTYWAFGLSSCDAEEWLRENPQLLAKARPR